MSLKKLIGKKVAKKVAKKIVKKPTQKDIKFSNKKDIAMAKDTPFGRDLDVKVAVGKEGKTAGAGKINIGDDVVGFTNFIKMQQSKSGLNKAKYKEKLNQITRSKDATKAQKEAAKKKIDMMDAKDESDFAATGRKISQSLTGKKQKPDDYKIAQKKLDDDGLMEEEFKRLTKNQQDALIKSAKIKQSIKKGKGMAQGGLKMPTADQTGLKKLPTPVRNKMGYMYGGGMTKKPRMSNMDYRKGGMVIIALDLKKKGKK